MKNKELLLKTIFLLYLIIVILGVMLKVLHWDGSNLLIAIGFVMNLFYMILSIYEVNISKRIERTEKIMWTVGLICISSIVGFVYIFTARHRIVNN